MHDILRRASLASSIVLALVVGGRECLAADRSPSPSDVDFFEKHVRPVLVEHCQSCHGPEKAKAGLRLDTAEGLKAGGESGPVVSAGDPRKSRLIEAVEYGNSDLQMPPKGKLPPQAIAALTKWVSLGAPFPASRGAGAAKSTAFDLSARKDSHWCWRPLAKPTPPVVSDARWNSTPVDAFLQARRLAAGVSSAPHADKPTLIRRLYFDLVGLPPRPEEVLAFEADRSPEAWTKVVDRLLASPHFGERWARHWLDLVRYAESRGHEHDHTQPNAFQYRDYVIRAFNGDVRYDQFVVEHIAGDLLASPRRHPKAGFNESVLGTGFWALGEQLHSPVDLKQDEADRIDNSLDVMSKTFLGLTVSCARCHDHKFDAISAKDYYALAGFALGAHYRQVRLEDDRNLEAGRQLTKLQETAGPALLRTLADAVEPALRAGDGWKKPIAKAMERDTRAKRLMEPKGDPKKTRWLLDFSDPKAAWMPDGVGFGTRPARRGELQLSKPIRFTETAAAEKSPVADRLRPAPGSEDEPGGMGGRNAAGRTLRTPTFTLQSGSLHYLIRGKAKVYAAVQSHTMIAGPLHGAIVRRFDAGPDFRWVTHDLSVYPTMRVHLEFVPDGPADFALAAVVEGEVPSPGSSKAMVDSREATAAMASAVAEWRRGSAAGSASLANWWLAQPQLLAAAEAAKLKTVVEDLRSKRDAILKQMSEEASLAPAVAEGTGVDLQVFLRGSPKALGPMAKRRMLEALVGDASVSSGAGSGRLELARQMVDPSVTPLTPRVMANRIWHHLFGRGIVASVDNFGVLGEPPTHPELLDFLAAEFVADGWSVKRMIRRLVLTQTYQMSSRSDPAMEERDPGNRLWHRMPVRRLEGEAVRDAILAVSGRLDPTMFGKAVPVHLTEFQDGRGRPASGTLDGDGRRSIYLAVRRNFLSPFLLAYDTPIPFSTVGRRTDSNVPAQALALMNDPFVRQQSERWAAAIQKASGSDADRIERMYLQAFARRPTSAERQTVERFLKANSGDAKAWNQVAHALFNAKEFCFIH